MLLTVVCIFSPSLHPTPYKPTSFPHLHPNTYHFDSVKFMKTCGYLPGLFWRRFHVYLRRMYILLLLSRVSTLCVSLIYSGQALYYWSVCLFCQSLKAEYWNVQLFTELYFSFLIPTIFASYILGLSLVVYRIMTSCWNDLSIYSVLICLL